MLIVGLNAFHPDSSACVLKDGRLETGNLKAEGCPVK